MWPPSVCPFEAETQPLFNCAAVFHSGRLLAVIPKTFLPNYNDFYEKRWFGPPLPESAALSGLCGTEVPFGENILFKNTTFPLDVGVEICEAPLDADPAQLATRVAGANLILNSVASNETVDEIRLRRERVRQQAARCLTGYAFASAGQGESTTDVVFSGHAMLAANGVMAGESSYTEVSSYIFADIDIGKLLSDRRKFNSFMGGSEPGDYRAVEFGMQPGRDVKESFSVDPHPFIPQDKAEKFDRCKEIFKLQSRDLPSGCGKRE